MIRGGMEGRQKGRGDGEKVKNMGGEMKNEKVPQT